MPEIRIRDGLPCKGVALPTTFVEPGRWYEVEADVAAYAATVRLHPTSAPSPLVFEVREANATAPPAPAPEPELIGESEPQAGDVGEGGSGEARGEATEAGGEEVTASPAIETAAEPPVRARRRRDVGEPGKEGGGRA